MQRSRTVAELEPDKVLFGLRGQSQVRECLRGPAEGPGVVTLTWAVSKSGDPSEVEVSRSTLADADIEHCLVEAVSQLYFGNLETDAKASWTFVKDVEGLERDDSEGQSGKKNSKKPAKRGKNRRDETKRRDEDFDRGISIDGSSRGWLDPDAIESVVQSGFKLYAHCFREGFGRDEWLSGVVRLRFTIDPGGDVLEVKDAGSDFPDHQTIGCIAEGFYALAFPAPKGGSLSVVYPIIFNQRDEDEADEE